MINMPKTLKIGGHQYEVIFPYVFTERCDRIGDHDGAMKVIRIADVDGGSCTIAGSSIFVILIHEILHAIDQVAGHDMFIGDEGEKHIEAISEGIYQVIVDNPQLFDVITK